MSNITNPSNWTGSNPTPTSGTTIANRSALIHKTATPFSGPAGAPTATCQDFSVTLDGSGNATLIPSDMDGGTSGGTTPYSYAASQTAYNCAHTGGVTVTLTVTDASSATASCTATVTAEDNTAPDVASDC